MLIPVLGVLIGLVIGSFVPFYVSPAYSSYLAVALLAALDTVFGGITANFHKSFSMPVFISGFFGNALLAALIVYIGERLGINLVIAVVVVFGTRLFQNSAIIRRFLLNKFINSGRID